MSDGGPGGNGTRGLRRQKLRMINTYGGPGYGKIFKLTSEHKVRVWSYVDTVRGSARPKACQGVAAWVEKASIIETSNFEKISINYVRILDFQMAI